jgi:shikimate kinase
MRVGRGRAHAAVGILNATATGIGCALAVSGGIEAEWAWTDEPGLRFSGPGDGRLAQAVLAQTQRDLRLEGGARVQTVSTFPPSRGLKTSSGAAAAMVLAAHDAAGAPLSAKEAIPLAVSACEAAGVTLTGAYDDQVAVARGGCHVTDNHARQILHDVPVAPWHVAVWVPQASIAKSSVARIQAAGLGPQLDGPTQAARRGDIPLALTQSGAAFAKLYASHGLPVSKAPAAVALAHGALGAGLSGTGPAVAALFEAPVQLPEVPDGAWSWHRAVEAAP